MRIQLLSGVPGSPQTAVTATPNPTEDGVIFTTPEILPEGDPRTPSGVASSSQIQQLTAQASARPSDGLIDFK